MDSPGDRIVDTTSVVPKHAAVTEESLAKVGRRLSSCMLDRYAITTSAVILGVFLGARKKNLRPFVSCVTIGTLSDLAYGYFFCCKDVIAEYSEMKQHFDEQKLKSTISKK